jgi:hypothetical protein
MEKPLRSKDFRGFFRAPARTRSRSHGCTKTLFVFIDNLTNKQALLSDTGALSANISILNRVATNQPRTIGADLNFKF